MNIFKNLMRNQDGNVMIISVFSIMIFTILAGSGVDLSIAYMQKEKMQIACDAGALAGRQIMQGSAWNTGVQAEAKKFFDFNFTNKNNLAENIAFSISQNPNDQNEIVGIATADVPTLIMGAFGTSKIPVKVNCNAKRDLGHNDVMLVLDVTGSMANQATGGGKKIDRLRLGAINLYRALQNNNGSVTRFGIVPYSHTVNVARSLVNNDFIIDQQYVKVTQKCSWFSCTNTYGSKIVSVNNSSWGSTSKTADQNMTSFRNSGSGCIEERTSSGTSSSNGTNIQINDNVVWGDITGRSSSSLDRDKQFGRYDPAIQEAESQDGCPAEATRLQSYASEASFQTAIDAATSKVTGGTYHDVGMIWGLRFIYSKGWFSSSNPISINGVPVKRHIVYMTDGILDTGETLYSADGVQAYQKRAKGTGTLNDIHQKRFQALCNLAKEDATVWIIALDVGNTDGIKPCATSSDHFYISDGSNLADIFKVIGQGIGNLRLTK